VQRAPSAPQLPATPFRFVAYFIARFRWWYVAMLVLETINSTCGILIPYATGQIIKAVTLAREQSLSLVAHLSGLAVDPRTECVERFVGKVDLAGVDRVPVPWVDHEVVEAAHASVCAEDVVDAVRVAVRQIGAGKPETLRPPTLVDPFQVRDEGINIRDEAGDRIGRHLVSIAW